MHLENEQDKITSIQALMHLLKAYVGTGILAMPRAFSYSGIVYGIIGAVIIGILCNTCIHMIIEINKHLGRKLKCKTLDYEEIASATIANGPESIRKYANITRYLVVVFLVLTQMGFCCTYCLFWAENIRKFLMNNEIPNASMSIRYYLLIILPFIILLNWIKTIKWLSIASTIANVILVISFAIIVYNLVQNVPSLSERTAFGSQLPLFFSTTVFSFEGITVIMPLYHTMKNQDNFTKPLGVVNCVLIIVIILYFLIGILGYLKYGDSVAAVITLSLPNEPLYNSLQILYSLVLAVSYPVQMYVAINQLWPPIQIKLTQLRYSQKYISIANYAFRAFLVIITFALAAFIPKLDLIIALIGAFSCSCVAIIIPPMLHTIYILEFEMNHWRKNYIYCRNSIIIVIGILGFITGTYYCIVDIIELFNVN